MDEERDDKIPFGTFPDGYQEIEELLKDKMCDYLLVVSDGEHTTVGFGNRLSALGMATYVREQIIEDILEE